MQVPNERIIIRNSIKTIGSTHAIWNTIPHEEQENLARRIERGCLEVTIISCEEDGIDRFFTDKKFLDRYSSNCSRVLAHLDANGSIPGDYLLRKLIAGEIDPHEVAKLQSKDLCPEASRAERNEIETRQMVQFERKVSTKYTCFKCFGKKTTFLEFQGKALDESSSFSIECVNCGNVWRK